MSLELINPSVDKLDNVLTKSNNLIKNVITGASFNGETLTLSSLNTSFTITGITVGSSTSDTFTTGGTFSNDTLSFINNTGGTYSVSGISSSDTFITGGTLNLDILSLTNNNDDVITISGFTSIGSSNRFTTGGTFSNNTLSLAYNNGITYNITGVNFTDTFTTGGTFSDGTLSLTDNSNNQINISGITFTDTNTFTTGSTFSSEGLFFQNNTGGTYSVSDIPTSSTHITGATYENNILSLLDNKDNVINITGIISSNVVEDDLLALPTTSSTLSGNVSLLFDRDSGREYDFTDSNTPTGDITFLHSGDSKTSNFILLDKTSGFTVNFPTTGSTVWEAYGSTNLTNNQRHLISTFKAFSGTKQKTYYQVLDSFDLQDLSAPILSNIFINNITPTSAIFNINTNEQSTIYWATFPSGTTLQSKSNVSGGTGSLDFGAITGLSSLTGLTSGLTAQTAYQIQYYAQDDEFIPNQTEVFISTGFTTAGFDIASFTISNDNTYGDLVFTQGVYNTNGGSGAIESSDLTISTSGGSATYSISAITQNDNTALSGASGLVGGESIVRVFLNSSGTTTGFETVTIGVNPNSIFNVNGQVMDSGQTGSDTTTVPLEFVVASATKDAGLDDNGDGNFSVTSSPARFVATKKLTSSGYIVFDVTGTTNVSAIASLDADSLLETWNVTDFAIYINPSNVIVARASGTNSSGPVVDFNDNNKLRIRWDSDLGEIYHENSTNGGVTWNTIRTTATVVTEFFIKGQILPIPNNLPNFQVTNNAVLV